MEVLLDSEPVGLGKGGRIDEDLENIAVEIAGGGAAEIAAVGGAGQRVEGVIELHGPGPVDVEGLDIGGLDQGGDRALGADGGGPGVARGVLLGGAEAPVDIGLEGAQVGPAPAAGFIPEDGGRVGAGGPAVLSGGSAAGHQNDGEVRQPVDGDVEREEIVGAVESDARVAGAGGDQGRLVGGVGLDGVAPLAGLIGPGGDGACVGGDAGIGFEPEGQVAGGNGGAREPLAEGCQAGQTAGPSSNGGLDFHRID